MSVPANPARIWQYFVIALALALVGVSGAFFVTTSSNRAAISALQADGTQRQQAISALEQQVRSLGAEPVTEPHAKASSAPRTTAPAPVHPAPEPSQIHPLKSPTAPPKATLRATPSSTTAPSPQPTCRVTVAGVCIKAPNPPNHRPV